MDDARVEGREKDEAAQGKGRAAQRAKSTSRIPWLPPRFSTSQRTCTFAKAEAPSQSCLHCQTAQATWISELLDGRRHEVVRCFLLTVSGYQSTKQRHVESRCSETTGTLGIPFIFFGLVSRGFPFCSLFSVIGSLEVSLKKSTDGPEHWRRLASMLQSASP